jgi:hypothetical protein
VFGLPGITAVFGLPSIGESLGEVIGGVLFVLCLTVLYRPAWPKPQRIDLGRLRTSAGRRALTVSSTVGSAIGFLIFGGLYAMEADPKRMPEYALLELVTRSC